MNSDRVLGGDTDLDNPANHWLRLIGRIHAGANAALIEAEMQVELKQWLRSTGLT